MLRILAGALALVCLFASSVHAQITLDQDGRYRPYVQATTQIGPRTHYKAYRRVRHQAYVWHGSGPSNAQRVTAAAVEGSFRGGMAHVCAGSSCGNVVSWAAEKFRGLFADLAALGYDLGHPGCYSATGHMRNSLHHWGGACDLFNQIGRNRTALRQPPPQVQIELAAKHGLTSGCAWRNPDCGHFDLSGVGMGHRYARRSRLGRGA